jgi:carbamoyl-phosphate synthase large subunit
MPALLLERLLDLPVSQTSKCTAGQMFVRHSVDLVDDFAGFAAMATSGERTLCPVQGGSELRK